MDFDQLISAAEQYASQTDGSGNPSDGSTPVTNTPAAAPALSSTTLVVAFVVIMLLLVVD